MGNACRKASKPPKKPSDPANPNDLAQPPTLRNPVVDSVRDQTNREHISLLGEKDPLKIFDKITSPQLTEVLQAKTFDIENYLVKIKELDIDVIMAIVKRIEGSDLTHDKFKRLEPHYKSLKENFVEYQSKYLSLQPKDSKDMAMQFLRIFIESYHTIMIHDGDPDNEKKTYYKSWANQKTEDYTSDNEYLFHQFNQIDHEMRKFFGGASKSIPDERNIEMFRNITHIFIQEIFEFSIKKVKEESFVESWGVDHLGNFGRESDHKAMKCFDYKFEIHMMSH